jgi:hypothetical protein
MISPSPDQATAQNISESVIYNDERLPEADQFENCATSDIAYALHKAANIYTSRAEAIMGQNTAALDEEDDFGANGAIKFVLMWWKQVAAQGVARIASNGDRDTITGSLVTCLDNNIKDLEWELL